MNVDVDIDIDVSEKKKYIFVQLIFNCDVLGRWQSVAKII